MGQQCKHYLLSFSLSVTTPLHIGPGMLVQKVETFHLQQDAHGMTAFNIFAYSLCAQAFCSMPYLVKLDSFAIKYAGLMCKSLCEEVCEYIKWGHTFACLAVMGQLLNSIYHDHKQSYPITILTQDMSLMLIFLKLLQGHSR